MAGISKKTSWHWFELTEIDWRGLDPDGWDRSRLFYSFDEKIKAVEYIRRLRQCTFARHEMSIDKLDKAERILIERGNLVRR